MRLSPSLKRSVEKHPAPARISPRCAAAWRGRSPAPRRGLDPFRFVRAMEAISRSVTVRLSPSSARPHPCREKGLQCLPCTPRSTTSGSDTLAERPGISASATASNHDLAKWKPRTAAVFGADPKTAFAPLRGPNLHAEHTKRPCKASGENHRCGSGLIGESSPLP